MRIINYIAMLFIKLVLYIAYVTLYVIYKGKNDDVQDPPHLISPPSSPIESHALALALSPKTPKKKLIKYSKDPDPFIRSAVCRNPSLPREFLLKLSQDKNKGVVDEARRVLDAEKL